MPKKLTKEEFVQRCVAVHGDKYDYSKVEYINSETKVCVVCPVHGDFYIRPSDLFNGVGCSKCKGNNKSTKEEFIDKARKTWGDKYDYSKVEYKGNKVKVCIICPEHGEFWQRPNDHLTGYGCIKCAGKYHPTTEEWIEKAKKVHGDKYDYSKVVYKRALSKITIICPKHGEFEQTGCNHLCGCGCPTCNSNLKSKMEDNIGILLDAQNIVYERQKTFEWLKMYRNLYIDFYLPDYNIAIEVQGEQHFVPVKKFGGEKEHNLQVKRDKKKYDLCCEHKIKVFYITKRNNNIDEVLKYINDEATSKL